MTDEERGEEREQGAQEEMTTPGNPNVVYRPIEVEVNLMRRRLNSLVFLSLVLSLMVLAVMIMMYRTQKNERIGITAQYRTLQTEYNNIVVKAQQQNQVVQMILGKLNALRATNMDVANLWKELGLQNAPGAAGGAAEGAASGNGMETAPQQ